MFCDNINVDYTDNTTTANVANFLCDMAHHSERPESVLKSCLAALNFLFQGMGKSPPTHSGDIDRLVTALVKTCTKRPMKRQKPMPISAFVDLFEHMGPNCSLSLNDLRLKAITLLALTAMTRPSDLAPKAKQLSSIDNSLVPVTLSVNDVNFEEDGSMTIHFHGTKNDYNRQGFEVNIPPNADNSNCDPVECLRSYINRTESCRSVDMNALLITLRPPYRAIKADTVASILDESIKRAGLQGFSAKSFRPTGASTAVALGVLPETVMKLGRWKTKEVFLNHYVYAKVPVNYTEKLFQADK